jgi:tetratricopeptide (TPR) repeat protein
MTQVWNPTRRTALERSLRSTGSPFAVSGFQAAAAALDRYATDWRAMHRSACEATHLAGTQSPELLDLRMACLDARRQELETLLALLASDGAGPSETVDATHSLTPLGRCADTRALLATVPPPEPARAQDVADVRAGLATAGALEKLGRYAEGGEVARRLAATAEELAYWPLTAEVLLRQGILEERGSEAEAADTLARAVDAAVAGGDDPTAAEALVHLVRVHGYQRADHERAHYYGRLATAALARLGEPAELTADLADHLGRLAYQEGRHREALVLHRRALDRRRRALGDEQPEVGSTLLRLATVYADLGELEEARRLAEHAVDLYRQGYGEGHPRLALGLVHLGDLHYRGGDPAAAEAAQRQALAIRQAALGPDHPQTADVQLRLANTLLQEGRTGEARDLLGRLEAVVAEHLGSEHPRMADVQSSLGSVHLERREYRLAAERFQRALAIQEEVYGPAHPWVADSVYNLGVVSRAMGDPATARRRFERALGVWEAAYGADHPLVGHALTGIGQSLVALGRPTEALSPLERALLLRQSQNTDPALVASTRFALAQALAASGGDRSRAVELANAATVGFHEARDREAEREVSAWLLAHGGVR